MSTPPLAAITSRDNPSLQRVRRLLADPAAYRRVGAVWLEGDHLLRAALARGWSLTEVLVAADHADDARLQPLLSAAGRARVVDPVVWRDLSSLEAPAPIGALLAWPAPVGLLPGVATVVLDRLQDAGNVGSILRSAAALGVSQVVALKGTAALWSPKVLRAGMGAHFGLHLVESADLADLDNLAVPLLATSSHDGAPLPQTALPQPAAWVFGHEGQGMAPDLLARCALRLRIPQPGGEESLNAAAAAAICLYESARQAGAACGPAAQ